MYIFEKPSNGWKNMRQTARLTAADGINCTHSTSCEFGKAVGISSDTITVGAPGSGQATQGVTYVYVKPIGGWKTTSKFNAKLLNPGDMGGFAGTPYSVGISGDTVVVGSDVADRAFVFQKPADGWSGDLNAAATLSASDGGNNQDFFGCSVGIDGNTIGIGAYQASNDIGEAYVFVKPASGWTDMTETARLTASDGNLGDLLGLSVAISGNTIVAGAPNAPYTDQPGPGVVYLFVKPQGGWTDMTQTAELTASDGGPNDGLGGAVSMTGKRVVAGALSAPHALRGALYLFSEPTTGWTNMTQTAKLIPSGGTRNDKFGLSVAINGRTITAGGPDSNSSEGRAWVFGKAKK